MKKAGFKKLYKLIAPHILDVGPVPLIKESLLYQIFADKLHLLVVSDPSSGAKSSYRKTLPSICPFGYAIAGGRSTQVGLAEEMMRLGEGIIQIDEIDKALPNEKLVLHDVMQFGVLKITKHNLQKEYPTKVNIYAICNPRGGHWLNYGNTEMMKDQIKTLSQPLLRRFHIAIFGRDYTPEEFDEVNRFKSQTKHKNPILTKEQIDFFNEYIPKAREITPKGKFPEAIYTFLKNLKIFEHDIITPITPELEEGIFEIAKAKARIKLSKKISDADWHETLKFFLKCLRTGGLSNTLIQKKLLSKETS